MSTISRLAIVALLLSLNSPVIAGDDGDPKDSYVGVGDKNEPPPPVDLRDKEEPLIVDPNDLKESDPKPPSLKIKPPPPLE